MEWSKSHRASLINSQVHFYPCLLVNWQPVRKLVNECPAVRQWENNTTNNAGVWHKRLSRLSRVSCSSDNLMAWTHLRIILQLAAIWGATPNLFALQSPSITLQIKWKPTASAEKGHEFIAEQFVVVVRREAGRSVTWTPSTALPLYITEQLEIIEPRESSEKEAVDLANGEIGNALHGPRCCHWEMCKINWWHRETP